MRLISALITFLSLFLLSCEKDATIIPKKFPFLQIKELSVLNNDGVILSGSVLNWGNNQIKEYGFVINTNGLPTIKDRIERINSNFDNNQFSIHIANDLSPNMSYYVRAYLKTENNLIYSAQQSFTSLGCKPPIVSKIDPSRGTSGSIITITGQFLGSNPESSIVYFGSKKAKVIKSNNDTIIAFCPDTDVSASVPVSVEVANKKTEYSSKFDLLNPWIKNKDFITDERIFCSSVVSGNFGYTTLGKVYSSSIYSAKSLWQFSYDTKEWSLKKEFPATERANPLAFTHNGIIYFGMGFNDNLMNKYDDLWAYNPMTDEWKQKSNFPGEKNNYNPLGFTIGDKVYVFIQPIGSKSELWIYYPIPDKWEKQDFQAQWSVKTDVNLKWTISYNGKGYFISNDEIWEFNPSNNTFILIKKFDDIYYADDFFCIKGILYLKYGYKLKTFEIKTGYTGVISCPFKTYSDINFQFPDRVFISETYSKEFWEFYPR